MEKIAMETETQLQVEVTLQTFELEAILAKVLTSPVEQLASFGVAPSRDVGRAIAPELLLTETLWTPLFQQWLIDLHPKLSPIDSYELTLRLTHDDEIQSLNRDYRQIDKPTDVLAFSALDEVMDLPDSLYMAMPFYLGDIIISVETASTQAQQQGHCFATELLWLATHGLLHLLGWDHPDDASLEQMLAQQDSLVSRLDI